MIVVLMLQYHHEKGTILPFTKRGQMWRLSIMYAEILEKINTKYCILT
jgi:hypothetical protein